MFNLLVKYTAWSTNLDVLDLDRVFEYTDPDLVAAFKPNGTLRTDLIAGQPSLLMTEIGGKGTQLARIAWIRNVSMGAKVTIQYTVDERFQPIPNERLAALATRLGIEEYELRRSHWAVKREDLFAELLAAQMAPLLAPKVFSLSLDITPRTVAVMMPFDIEFAPVYATIQAVARDLKLTCNRADDIWKHDAVIQDVVSLISTSAITICDCTGRNPNVFYEAGIAHAMGRDVILIVQSEHDVPFNLRHLRFVSYLNNEQGRATLSVKLSERLRHLVAS